MDKEIWDEMNKIEDPNLEDLKEAHFDYYKPNNKKRKEDSIFWKHYDKHILKET